MKQAGLPEKAPKISMAGSKNIVVFHKQLGDTLLLQPALAKLAAQQGAPVDLIVSPQHEPLVELMPDARPVHGPARGVYQTLWCFDPGSKSAMLSFRASAAHKRLFIAAEKWRRFYHRLVFDEITLQRRGKRYRARYYWDLVDIPGEHPFAPPVLDTPPEEWAQPGHDLEDYLLINMTSAWPEKSGDPGRWPVLISSLNEAGIGPLVLVGGKEKWQVEYNRQVISAVRAPITNLAGRTSLRELLYIVSKARMILTVDGAISHLAQALKRPCLTMFGPTNPIHWHYDSQLSVALWAGDYSVDKKPHLDALPNGDIVDRLTRLWKQFT
jgi:ADP-heptose:LPS heptosyltransferase